MTPISRKHILDRDGNDIFDETKFHYKRQTFPKTPFNYIMPNSLEWVDDYLKTLEKES